jgi:RNA polymerase sigma-70 factor (ECF subfamily)
MDAASVPNSPAGDAELMSDRAPDERSRWIRNLLDAHEAALLRYATRLLGDSDKARDVVQETFLRLCAEKPPAAESYVAAWLFRVCRHRALDVLRREKRNMTALTNMNGRPSEHEPSPVLALERDESISELLGLLNKLPDNQQEVIRLKFQAGLRYHEIAQVTGLSVSNVGFLIHTAIKRLRERLVHQADSPAL